MGGIKIEGETIDIIGDINIKTEIINIESTKNEEKAIKIWSDFGTSSNSINILSDVGGINITGGINSTTAIQINASNTTGGGINIDAKGKVANAIYIHTNGGIAETIKINSDLGTSSNSINILSDVGGININGGKNKVNAIQINASNTTGGINIDAGSTGIQMDATGDIVIT